MTTGKTRDNGKMMAEVMEDTNRITSNTMNTHKAAMDMDQLPRQPQEAMITMRNSKVKISTRTRVATRSSIMTQLVHTLSRCRGESNSISLLHLEIANTSMTNATTTADRGDHRHRNIATPMVRGRGLNGPNLARLRNDQSVSRSRQAHTSTEADTF